MTTAILVLNAGSSSIKFALHPADSESAPEIRGKITGVGRDPAFSARGLGGKDLSKGSLTSIDQAASHEEIVSLLLQWLSENMGSLELVAVGHRVVHGGADFWGPVVVDDGILTKLEELIPLAPLHQPHNLAAIRAVAGWQDDLVQIACFDTSFHRTQDRLAQLFALPRDLSEEGIIRYGFHGLSYDYISTILPNHLGERADGRVVIAHLGNGASMCATKERKSVATSMGFTALDGLMMGRRCGTLDAGVVLYLMQSKGMSAAGIEDLLYRKSGLQGVSGISNNMQVLEQSDAPKAKEAIDLFCFRAASVLSGLIPAIGGLDALVFTAGIGENSANVRSKICAHFEWLGVQIDESANAENAVRISTADSGCDVLVLNTDEEFQIAQSVREVLG